MDKEHWLYLQQKSLRGPKEKLSFNSTLSENPFQLGELCQTEIREMVEKSGALSRWKKLRDKVRATCDHNFCRITNVIVTT